jgi:serine/alanine adding enzyme
MHGETIVVANEVNEKTLAMESSPQYHEAGVLNEKLLPAWDHFVTDHPDASVYHFSIWRQIVHRAFGKEWYVVGVHHEGKVLGGIPLVHMKSPLFGNFLVSMPYANYGGLIIENESLARPILNAAIKLGQELKVKHIELRHLKNYFPELPARMEKVSMWLPLPQTSEDLFNSFKPKLRSQIRKGEKNGLSVQDGGGELLDEFYTVFAHNMRALGTPVYGKDFFRFILEAFPKGARIILVRDPQAKPIAAGFLLGFRDRLEIPWASSLREYNHLQSNMFLYWNCLQYACSQGYRVFDFGRSTIGATTFKFKEQWGSKPVPHYWHYYLNGQSDLPQLNPNNPKFHLAISIWQHLPLAVTRWVGPSVAKHLP